MNKTTFEILNYSNTHTITRVITASGRQYEGMWAIARDEEDNIISPTIEEVKTEWKQNRKSFDLKRGCY